MSLFDSLLFGDEDDIFGMHMRSLRQMNNMMSSMMNNNFNDMFRGFEAITGPPVGISNQLVPRNHHALLPFQFPDLNTNRLLMCNSMPDAGMSYSSSSYVSMTRGPDGRQQVYKATSSAHTGPGGICETKKTVEDSRTGVRKLAIGHHIGERAHVVERQKNEYTGEEEENVELINLDDDEAESFDNEFQEKAGRVLDNGNRRYIGNGSHGAQLALPAPPAPSTSAQISNPHPINNVASEQSTPDESTNESTPIVTIIDDDDDEEAAEIQTSINNTTQPSITITSSQSPSINRRNIVRNNVKTRRPLRSPASSPLASSSSSSHATSTSIHSHPYNTNIRRPQHRAMKGSYHQHNPGTH